MYVLIFVLVFNYIFAPIIKMFTDLVIGFDLPGDVWTLLQIGLGGYVVGRSGESIAKSLANRSTTTKQE
jgi:hypothetical protein